MRTERADAAINYHPDDFLSLIQEVEDQGGAHLSGETCKPRSFRMNLPIDWENPQGPKRNERVLTTGCHRTAKFLVPLMDGIEEEAHELDSRFDFEDHNHRQAMMQDGLTPALAKVCAVDDSMGLWPRFQAAMHTGDSFEPFE